jgi:arylsulfatase A-like enzyme
MKKSNLSYISRRSFLKFIGAGSAALSFSGCGSSFFSQKELPERPNIIFIYSDDHAYQAISGYGGRLGKVAPTPNIDRIINEGMRFDRSYVANSICAPARACILTGKHSHLNGVTDNRKEFDGSQQTFVKLLSEAGYQTAVIGKWHLKSKPTGFDHWEVLPGQGDYYNPDFITEDGQKREEGYVTDIVTDKALSWLENDSDTSKPFMLMLQHKAPHRNWQPPIEYLNLFDDVSIPEPDTLFDDYSGRGTAAKEQDMTIADSMKMGWDFKIWKNEDKGTALWKHSYGRLNDQQRKAWDEAYDAENNEFLDSDLSGKELVKWKFQRYIKDYLRCIRSVDDNVGRVLDYLDKSGLAENTMVIYSSDQGFYLGEHGWFDKRFMYEESFRTPLAARWPLVIKPGSVSRELVQNIDYASTFLSAAGLEPPCDMQGKSLIPLMKGQVPDDWRESLYYHYYEFPGAHSVRKHEGVVTKRYKLIHFYNLGEWEFYDLKKDPSEMKNCYDCEQYKDVVEDLKNELKELRIKYKVCERAEIE